MFGSNNNNPIFSVFLEENHYQYDTNAMPQLQSRQLDVVVIP